MGLRRWIFDRVVKGEVDRMSNDHKATILGAMLAALQAGNIDYPKLVSLDLTEVGKALAALVTAVLGYYINRKDARKKEPV